MTFPARMALRLFRDGSTGFRITCVRCEHLGRKVTRAWRLRCSQNSLMLSCLIGAPAPVCSPDAALICCVWLWWGLAAAALIRPLAWELPYAAGVTLKRPKKKKRKKKKRKEGMRRTSHRQARYLPCVHSPQIGGRGVIQTRTTPEPTPVCIENTYLHAYLYRVKIDIHPNF